MTDEIKDGGDPAQFTLESEKIVIKTKRVRRKKEVKPRAPRVMKSKIVIMAHDADHDMYNAVTNADGALSFANVRLAVKHIREELADGEYVVMRSLCKKIKSTETIKKSVLK